MKKSPLFTNPGRTTLIAVALITHQASATDYYHFGQGDGSRIHRADQYSNTDGSLTPATVDPGEIDNLFFYNSTATGPADRTLATGPYHISFNSIHFRNNAGTTKIDRGAIVSDRDNATVLSIGKGGITVDSGAGAVTIGGVSQRVLVGATADFKIVNNSSNDLTFSRVFGGRTDNTTHTVTVGGSGSGNTIFVEGIRSGNKGRNLAITIDAKGTGTVRLDGMNDYTGDTTVLSGKLFINEDSKDATGPVRVSAGATLGGRGTIGGDVTIANDGCLEFNVGTSPKRHDSLSLADGRSLTISGNSVLTITSSGTASVGKYKLLTAPGGISGNAPATLNLPEGWAGTVSIAGNNLVLDLTAVGAP